MKEDNNMELNKENLPVHIAIIMDGNRRWAKEKDLETKQGHKEGAENLKRIAKYANEIGIKYLTVYAFSTENWKRTEEEVGALMFLLKWYLNDLLNSSDLDNVKINVLGDITRLDPGIQKLILKLEDKTKDYTGLKLNIAFNYGGRDEITRAVKSIATSVKNNEISVEDINEDLISNNIYTAGMPDPDLLIRPGGEKRISNFLPWQLSYTEFIFTDKYWPDFNRDDLDEAILEYERRNRKFGAK
ncbi:MAG: isoprenyl transferase [Clostridia bacterium]|jgi:undecaprenyl diphosphate synthase